MLLLQFIGMNGRWRYFDFADLLVLSDSVASTTRPRPFHPCNKVTQ